MAITAVESRISEIVQVVGVYVLKAIGAIATFIAGLIVAMFLRKATLRALRLAPPEIADLMSKIVYYSVAFLAGVAALSVAGVNVSGLLLTGGIIGVALGFASQTVVSNFLSGVFLYIDRPFRPGDPVSLDDANVSGVVHDVSIFSTRIRTWDGIFVRVPNDKVFNATIKNFSMNVARRVEYLVSISYSSDIELARKVILRVLDEEPLILREPPPEVFVEELGDSGVVLRVRFWVPSQFWFNVKMRMLERIKVELEKAGIEIPFPQRVVWLHMVGKNGSS
ncbi:MAG TPA: mechanosensitive ion channel family protein [Pyrodictium sp.]|nr:mechanosensitive ion channel family protein [Pyrodictium sp.]